MFKTYKNATRIFFVASFFLFTTSCVYKKSRAVVQNEPIEKSNAESSQHAKVDKVVVKNLTSSEFKQLIMDFDSSPNEWKFKGTRPVVIDFYATWCGPCRQMAPIIYQVAELYFSKGDFYRVDVDEEGELANWMQIQSIPTFMFIPTIGMPTVRMGSMADKEMEQEVVALLQCVLFITWLFLVITKINTINNYLLNKNK